MVLAYYMASSNGNVNRTGQIIREGETVEIEKDQKVSMYECGFHGCLDGPNTLYYNTFGMMTLVEIEGDIIIEQGEIVGRRRKTLKIWSVEETQKKIKKYNQMCQDFDDEFPKILELPAREIIQMADNGVTFEQIKESTTYKNMMILSKFQKKMYILFWNNIFSQN